MKSRNTSRILCDSRISIKLKGKSYKIVVRLVIFYGTKCETIN